MTSRSTVITTVSACCPPWHSGGALRKEAEEPEREREMKRRLRKTKSERETGAPEDGETKRACGRASGSRGRLCRGRPLRLPPVHRGHAPRSSCDEAARRSVTVSGSDRWTAPSAQCVLPHCTQQGARGRTRPQRKGSCIFT